MKNSRRNSDLNETFPTQDVLNITRIEKFTDEDLDDWLFEHDPKVIQEAEAGKERLRQGGGITLEELRRELGV